ncbi:hypothetical protein BGZ95_001321 [Linnemannia exigua]|uniref:Uncharacterized protein n=1 Tax=Linnemannia exigua TaxID=604196 RepID=A0AAD4D7K8_9FUNG|nr:hypothetical protein BGZ95_001321 [Linnemannia exigua]
MNRIPHYPDDIIDILTASQVQSLLSPPLSSSLFDKAEGHEISHIQHQLERSTDQQSMYHQQLLEQLVQMMREQAASKEREERMLQEQEESKAREEKMLIMQQETIDRLIVNQQRVDAVLVQNYELHEYPIPRLFVILPETYERWDPRSLLTERFRLYFLCECGEHCRTDSVRSGLTEVTKSNNNTSTMARIKVKNSIHLASHEGYEISRPTDFIDRYGPYVLGMLRILKHCLTVASIVTPVTQGSLDDVVRGVEALTKSTLEAVDMSIGFLEQKLDDTKALDEKGDREDRKEEHVFERLAALEGADLRRLETFLRNKDKDKILGNLYRITTEVGHVKWVCFEHYREAYRETAMKAFLQALETNAGVYDPQLRLVTISLKSSTTAQDFFKRLSNQAPAITELDVALDWKVVSSDLTMLVESLAKSNIRYLRLDLKEKYGEDRSRREAVLPGKGKYQPILNLLFNRKLQGLVLANMYHFGLRTTQLTPSSSQAPVSFLRSFHYLQLVKATDEPRLIGILSLCPGLVDVRLGSFNYFSDPCSSLSRALGTLSKLESLHLHYMISKDVTSGGDIGRDATACPPYGINHLRELVCFGISFDINLLEGVTRRSATSIQVLALRTAGDQTRLFNLYPVDYKAALPQLNNSSPPHYIAPSEQPFSKLTHLDLRLLLTKPSMDLLAVVLPRIELVHFGASGEIKELLKYVNYASLKSISLSDMDDKYLKPFHDAVFPLGQSFTPQQPLQFSSQIECIRLGRVNGFENVAPLVRAIPLKRLHLLGVGHRALLCLMGIVNLSHLQELSLFENTYDWSDEAALAYREREFCEDFVVKYGYLDHIGLQEAHLEESRGLQGTGARLARGRVQAVGMQRLFEEYSQSVFGRSS